MSQLQPKARQEEPAPSRAGSLRSSFGYAFQGIAYLLRTQRNAKIHVAISLIVIIAGWWLAIDRSEWLVIVVMIALVLAAEGFNTALEATVDLASPGRHPLAKVAKDVAAGTVLVTAIAAVIIGMIIFIPRLWPLLLQFLL